MLFRDLDPQLEILDDRVRLMFLCPECYEKYGYDKRRTHTIYCWAHHDPVRNQGGITIDGHQGGSVERVNISRIPACDEDFWVEKGVVRFVSNLGATAPSGGTAAPVASPDDKGERPLRMMPKPDIQPQSPGTGWDDLFPG